MPVLYERCSGQDDAAKRVQASKLSGKYPRSPGLSGSLDESCQQGNHGCGQEYARVGKVCQESNDDLDAQEIAFVACGLHLGTDASDNLAAKDGTGAGQNAAGKNAASGTKSGA